MNIGEKIRTARLAKNMTQEELGALLGVQKSAIAKYESGRVVNIKRSTLKKISDSLDIRPAELIFGEDTLEETAAKVDVAVNIVKRLGDDAEFCEAVKLLDKLDETQLSSVKQILITILK